MRSRFRFSWETHKNNHKMLANNNMPGLSDISEISWKHLSSFFLLFCFAKSLLEYIEDNDWNLGTKCHLLGHIRTLWYLMIRIYIGESILILIFIKNKSNISTEKYLQKKQQQKTKTVWDFLRLVKQAFKYLLKKNR